MAINEKAPGDSGYKAFFKGKTADVYAPSSYKAQLAAAVHFKARKSYDVTVMICEQADGEQVTHSTASL